jgi:hypothetical protein
MWEDDHSSRVCDWHNHHYNCNRLLTCLQANVQGSPLVKWLWDRAFHNIKSVPVILISWSHVDQTLYFIQTITNQLCEDEKISKECTTYIYAEEHTKQESDKRVVVHSLCLLGLLFTPDDEGSTFLRNVSKLLLHYTVLHRVGWYSSQPVQWESQIQQYLCT